MSNTPVSIAGFAMFGLGALWLAYGFGSPLGHDLLSIIVPIGAVKIPGAFVIQLVLMLVGLVLIALGRRY